MGFSYSQKGVAAWKKEQVSAKADGYDTGHGIGGKLGVCS